MTEHANRTFVLQAKLPIFVNVIAVSHVLQAVSKVLL